MHRWNLQGGSSCPESQNLELLQREDRPLCQVRSFLDYLLRIPKRISFKATDAVIKQMNYKICFNCFSLESFCYFSIFNIYWNSIYKTTHFCVCVSVQTIYFRKIIRWVYADIYTESLSHAHIHLKTEINTKTL